MVYELDTHVYLDGFAMLSAGQDDLEMNNGTLALTSDYETKSATFGGPLTGVYSQKGFGFIPGFALTYGKTWLGDVASQSAPMG